MKVAFHLRRVAVPRPAVAAWLDGRDLVALFSLCDHLGLDPRGRVFDVAGGFLLKLDVPTDRTIPGAVRLCALAADLLIPVDAELVPALLDDEAAGLVRDRGLIFLPAGGVLGFDPKASLSLDTLLTARVLPVGDWQAFPEPPRLADRIEGIVVQLEDELPGDEFGGDEAGAIGVGGEPTRPRAVGPASTLLGKAAMRAGQGVARLGGALGWGKLSKFGSEMVDKALRLAPRLSEDLIGRQAAALNDLLSQFRNGDVENALRRALPLSTQGGSGCSGKYGSDVLPPRDLSYGLRGLIGEGGSGWGAWLGGQDLFTELTREYRKAAEQAMRQGDFRRAAVIYGKLLRDYRSAANALLRGGLHHDAAVLLLTRLDDPRAAARAFESAGETDQALQLYRKVGEHGAAGDLLTRIGEEEEALLEYRTAAALLAKSAGGNLNAGNLIQTKTGRSDLALPYFSAGWALRPAANAVACALKVALTHADAGDVATLRALVDEADAYFLGSTDLVEAGGFYNSVAELAARQELETASDELRDRALMGLAAQIRRRVQPGETTSGLVSGMLGRHDAWTAAQVSDASFAVSAAARAVDNDTPDTTDDPTIKRLRFFQGTVTAATDAPRSGEVFLGFEEGEVYVFRAARSEMVRVASYDLPVAALATDRDGAYLVVLRKEDTGAGAINAYERQPDGSYRPLQSMRLHNLKYPWLTPLLEVSPETIVGLYDGGQMHIISVASMTTWTTLDLPWSGSAPATALLLADQGHRSGVEYTILTHDGREWQLIDPEVGTRQMSGLSWCPELADDSPLASVPLSRAGFTAGNIDLAGLGLFGSLHWARLQEGELVATNMLAMPEGSGYCATAIVRDCLVAGVTRTRVDWLRCGHRKFSLWRSTEVSLPSPVACFRCQQTGELVVVCEEGTVARVKIPG